MVPLKRRHPVQDYSRLSVMYPKHLDVLSGTHAVGVWHTVVIRPQHIFASTEPYIQNWVNDHVELLHPADDRVGLQPG